MWYAVNNIVLIAVALTLRAGVDYTPDVSPFELQLSGFNSLPISGSPPWGRCRTGSVAGMKAISRRIAPLLINYYPKVVLIAIQPTLHARETH